MCSSQAYSSESLWYDIYIDFSEDIDFIDLNQIMTFDEYLSMLEENYDIKEQEMNMKMIR